MFWRKREKNPKPTPPQTNKTQPNKPQKTPKEFKKPSQTSPKTNQPTTKKQKKKTLKTPKKQRPPPQRNTIPYIKHLLNCSDLEVTHHLHSQNDMASTISRNSIYPSQNPQFTLRNQAKTIKSWRMSETAFKFHSKFLGYNVLSPQPVLMAGASVFFFQWAVCEPHRLDMEKAWNKHVWFQLDKTRLRKLPGTEPKSRFGKKKKKLGEEFLAGAFTYQLLKFRWITITKKETRRHHSLCFLNFPMNMIVPFFNAS